MTREQLIETMARQLGLEEHRPLPPEPRDRTWRRLDVDEVIRQTQTRKLL